VAPRWRRARPCTPAELVTGLSKRSSFDQLAGSRQPVGCPGLCERREQLEAAGSQLLRVFDHHVGVFLRILESALDARDARRA
jgi:hypothetical protein